MNVAIIQARMSSTRLPGKSLMPLAGRPLIHHVVDRISACLPIDKVVLATTDSSADDILADWAINLGLDVYRGSELDVLGRFHGAAMSSGASIIFRITADDPFKDPKVIESVFNQLTDCELDFSYNNNPPSFPEGLDAEVFTFDALDRAAFEALDPFEREHVTQYFYRHPEIFRQKNLSCDRQLSSFRWTIDTIADYQMAQAVYDRLYQRNSIFLMDDVLCLLKLHPEIAALNANEKRSTMYLRPI
jgi:spore coat polysaccharide biosynthesis protein SpsF